MEHPFSLHPIRHRPLATKKLAAQTARRAARQALRFALLPPLPTIPDVEFLTPNSPKYDQYLAATNLRTTLRPALRALCKTGLVPKATTIAVLMDTNYQGSLSGLTDVEAAAHSLGQQLIVLHASSEHDLEVASATLDQQRPGALIVLGAAFFLSQRDQIVALAAHHGVPAIYQVPDFVAAGGLMSYGASIRDAYRLVGVYTGKILHGAKPADLPVQQSTKLELIINLQTARRLGLTVPLTLQAAADEVIE